jgi:hypothetical protein
MTWEGMGEVFKGDSADTCAVKFPLMSTGGRANGQACSDGERGPPSARAEIYLRTVTSNPYVSKYNLLKFLDS